MTNPIVTQLIAADYQHRLTDDAARGRLVALATCCRPSRIVAALRAVHARLAIGQAPAACCA